MAFARIKNLDRSSPLAGVAGIKSSSRPPPGGVVVFRRGKLQDVLQTNKPGRLAIVSHNRIAIRLAEVSHNRARA